MARRHTAPGFPSRIDSDRLGPLHLKETPPDHRHYEPEGQLTITSRRVRVRPDGIKLVLWPPETGIPEPMLFVKLVEHRWTEIATRLDAILDASVGVITDAITYFWEIPGEAAPSAEALLRTGELEQLNLNAGDGGHVLIIFDRGDLVGGHDLNLNLTPRFQPDCAHFDG